MTKSNKLDDKIFAYFGKITRKLSNQARIDPEMSVENDSFFLRAIDIDKDCAPCFVLSKNLHEIEKNSYSRMPKFAEYSITILDRFKKDTINNGMTSNEFDVFLSECGKILQVSGGENFNQYVLPIKGADYIKAVDIMVTNFQQAIYETNNRLKMLPKTKQNREPADDGRWKDSW